MLKGNTHRLVGISLFGALGFVLMFIAFPVIPAFSYLKVDFSDLPILLSFLLYGPIGGVMSTLIRTILHYIQTGGDMGYPIGDFASFIATLSYCFPAYWLLKKSKSQKSATVAFLLGTLSLTVVLTIANLYIITPLYLKILNFSVGNITEYILAGVVPFNLIKGTIISLVFLMVLPKLRPWLVKQNKMLAVK
ncbi:ECF transporter S component [Jeotgalibaca sp. PTS2502]|uniref:ECF transporter S component n=1 Tax=Jeotgalibaca sp. PTS2502 TaxID=1903686 RepID=UPI0009737C48|nr:ECF transporter S component [Jeotgalibaca sp. PTS2502]APZ48869.1 ECF transporter S component [Jeotgalibaca sp. PTS2502]